MGSYNLKVYEYATGIQLRMYNQALIYSEKNQSVPLIGLIDEVDKKVHTCELLEERKERSFQVSASRAISTLYEIARANIWEYFVTFTFNRQKIDSSNYELLTEKVRIWLSHLKQRYAPNLKYILVPELHKDGVHYHFHALIANTGNIDFIDSGVKHNGNTIYNIGNWKFGFTTASKVIDSARASSYITKYITKDLCSVTKFKKRYWASRNCDRPKVRTYCLPYEEIGKFLDDNIYLLQYTKEVVIDSCGLAVTYIEMKKE